MTEQKITIEFNGLNAKLITFDAAQAGHANAKEYIETLILAMIYERIFEYTTNTEH